jgi:hypothetical protein
MADLMLNLRNFLLLLHVCFNGTRTTLFPTEYLSCFYYGDENVLSNATHASVSNMLQAQ